ncbi:MAG: PLP-dependent aminotransferase family protein [Firmicutes bacterium]|nr:PLP-dependent aminotransferase family protein [Bacillota bacterium]
MDEFDIKIDKSSQAPLYKQLSDAIFAMIEAGTLKTNEKLPPIRRLAEKTGVNNATVVSAYRHLESRKAVYSQAGSGTFVSPIPLEEIPLPVIDERIRSIKKPEMGPGIINFTSTSLPQELFPVDEFKQAFDSLLDRERGKAFGNMDSQGFLPLRESLCVYLESYGIRQTPDNIQVISGAQQGIDIVSKAMTSYGDVVFMEKPTFYGAAGAFLSRGCQIVEIPMENGGMSLPILENLAKLYRPKFIYVMAYFQTPTGISYSAAKKKAVLNLAEKYNFYIIEDDNLYDFNYTNENIVPFKALDHRNRVIYIKSFSKILMPGLRVGFAAMPKKIISKMTTAKYTTDISTSGFLQKALDIYFRENNWKEHIIEIQNYASRKYKLAVKYADRFLKPYVKYQKPCGGVSLWLELRNVNAEEVLKKCAEKNVLISPGEQFYVQNGGNNFLRLCFINVSDEFIETGIRRMGACLKDFTTCGKRV